MRAFNARKGAVVSEAVFQKAREEYYRISGWDAVTGNPTDARLRDLGFGWAVELSARSASPGRDP
jgi:aldehyde:ferredoxin oxidoreductase